MARFLKYLAFLAVLALWLAPGAAFAVANDVPQATLISNTCTITVASMADSLVNSNFDTRVAAIWGDTIDTAGAGNANANWGDTRWFTYYIYNTGNSNDTVWVWPTFTYHGGGDSFIVIIGSGTDTHTNVIRTGVPWPATDSIFVGPMGEDAVVRLSVAVGLPNVATGGNGNGDSLTVRINIMRDTAVTGQYNGDNGRAYAENSSQFAFDTVTVAGAVFAVTKTGTCTLGGALSPVVPGATIQYRIDWSNTGSGAGSNVTIYDQIDTASTTFVSYDTTASPGWLAQWGGAAADDFSIGSADFTSGNPGTVTNVRWIRFTNVTVAGATSGNIFYRVTIN